QLTGFEPAAVIFANVRVRRERCTPEVELVLEARRREVHHPTSLMASDRFGTRITFVLRPVPDIPIIPPRLDQSRTRPYPRIRGPFSPRSKTLVNAASPCRLSRAVSQATPSRAASAATHGAAQPAGAFRRQSSNRPPPHPAAGRSPFVFPTSRKSESRSC